MLSQEEVCELLHLKMGHLRSLIRRNVFTVSPAFKRNRLIPKSQVEDFVRQAQQNKRRQRNETQN